MNSEKVRFIGIKNALNLEISIFFFSLITFYMEQLLVTCPAANYPLLLLYIQ